MPEENIASKITGTKGLAGAIFWCTVVAIIMYAIGYSTTGWQSSKNRWLGLWSACHVGTGHPYARLGWFESTRFVSTVGLILFVASFLAIYMNLFVEKVFISKSMLLTLFIIFALLAVFFIVIALYIFAIKLEAENLHWSYAVVVFAAILLVVAVILAVVLKMKK